MTKKEKYRNNSERRARWPKKKDERKKTSADKCQPAKSTYDVRHDWSRLLPLSRRSVDAGKTRLAAGQAYRASAHRSESVLRQSRNASVLRRKLIQTHLAASAKTRTEVNSHAPCSLRKDASVLRRKLTHTHLAVSAKTSLRSQSMHSCSGRQGVMPVPSLKSPHDSHPKASIHRCSGRQRLMPVPSLKSPPDSVTPKSKHSQLF